MNNTQNAMLDFFETQAGVGAAVLPPVSRSSSLNYLDYTANLDTQTDQPYELSYNPKACTPKYIVYQCSCGRHIRPSTCMNMDCIPCQPFTTRRRAFSAFNRLRVEPKTVIYTIFTVPMTERYKFIDPKVWGKVRQKAWRILRNEFGGLFGIEASHPIGDVSREFNPHLNFLWIQKKSWQPYIDVEKLRRLWSALMQVTVADVYSRYTDSPGKIFHWCKYALRTFPGFMHWAGSVRWYGKYPKVEREDRRICATCGEEFKAIGWISFIDVNDWNTGAYLSGAAPPWMREDLIQHFKS